VTPSAFDPADAAERRHHLERRLTAAVLRIGDAVLAARVGDALRAGVATAVFDLLLDDDARVSAAAHECAMLRYAWIVAVAAETFGFDAAERDDLVQRTFLDLPRVVRRARADGLRVTHPEGWLRRRAHLIACQMLREERGTPARDRQGQLVRTRGTRVPVEALDDPRLTDVARDALDTTDAEAVADALALLAAERPLWAQVLRLHYFEGYGLDEIARRVGRTHGTVRNDAQRARARLLAILRERHPELAPRRAPGGQSA
jgi:RNA polymerase sigma factor (sigma-70 family)